jgi:hypothetical protein
MTKKKLKAKEKEAQGNDSYHVYYPIMKLPQLCHRERIYDEIYSIEARIKEY